MHMAKAGSNGGVYVDTSVGAGPFYNGEKVLPATMIRVTEVKEWQVDISQTTDETTSFDSEGWKEHLAVSKEWGGNIGANWDVANIAVGLDGQKRIFDAFMATPSVPLKLVFFEDMVETAGVFSPKPSSVYWGGEVVFEKVPPAAAISKVMEFKADFKGNRKLNRSNVVA